MERPLAVVFNARFPVVVSFVNSPVFYGTIFGIILSLIFFRDFTWRDYGKTAFLFLLFIYYWCRPGRGELEEMEVIRSAPALFKILLSAFVWLGCMQFWKNKLVKLAYFSILFIFLMRDQGQIILVYLTGLVWMPSRDNYIIDFIVALVAIVGLSELESSNIFVNEYKWWSIITPVSIITMFIVIFSASSNFYYSHAWMQKKIPSGYPFYEGVTKIRRVIQELRDSPTTRIFFVDDDDAWESTSEWSFTYGFGSSLLERVGQVTQYDSLNPKNYRDWAIYRRLGIRPEQKWGDYPAGYAEKTISKLPGKNTLGYNQTIIYSYTLMIRPPADRNTLRLLGVKYIIKSSSISNQMVKDIDMEDIRERKGITYPGIDNSLVTAQINNPLPRAFLVYGIQQQGLDEFMNEMSPIINEHTITTKSYEMPFSEAFIEKYEPEHVSIAVEAKGDAYLVLSDLYHPFWHVRVDGKETEIIPAFYIFRGVKVQQGKHVIDFYCKIPYFTISIIGSILIALLSVLVAIYYFNSSRYGVEK